MAFINQYNNINAILRARFYILSMCVYIIVPFSTRSILVIFVFCIIPQYTVLSMSLMEYQISYIFAD